MPAVVGAVALIVIEALAALARLPMVQVTVPEALAQVPTVEEAETKLSPAGRGSLTLTPVADRESTRLNSSHTSISYPAFCLKKTNMVIASSVRVGVPTVNLIRAEAGVLAV